MTMAPVIPCGASAPASPTHHAPAGLQRESLRALVASADVRLPAGPKLALIAIARCHDDRTRRSTCSLKTIAALSGVSEKQAGRNIEALVALGLIARLPRAGRSTSYLIDLVALAQARNCRPSDAAEAVDNPASTPDMFDTDPRHPDAPPRTFEPLTPDTHAPRTEGVLVCTEGGTEAREADAVRQPASPLPVAENLEPQAQAQAAEHAVAIAPDTLAAVNAQRVANGKAAFKRAELLDLHREATLAGLAPQAAAEWILARPGRNFFRADFASAASLTTPAVAPAGPARPVELSDAGRAALALRARYEAGLVLPPSTRPIAAPARPAAALQTMTLRRPAPTAVGGSTGTGWARKAVDRFLAAEPVNHATISSAAIALGLSLADLKAQRAARLATLAAVAA
jgi:Helix-turn-helix domain